MGRSLWAFIAVSAIGVAGFFLHTALKDFFSATGITFLWNTWVLILNNLVVSSRPVYYRVSHSKDKEVIRLW